MVLVFVAGIWGGTINTVVGSGTLVTFPVLLGVGLPPVTANVSNTIGLFPGSLAGAYGYRRELRGQVTIALRLGVAMLIGAVGGAILLLTLPPDAFEAIVPVLIVLALVLVVFGRRINERLEQTRHRRGKDATPALFGAMLFMGLYSGYFGAAAGVLTMGVFGVLLDEPLQRQNALKNVLVGFANFVAAVIFCFTAEVNWTAAGLVAAGAIIGGVLGARIGRRLSPMVLRAVIVIIGIAAIVKLLA